MCELCAEVDPRFRKIEHTHGGTNSPLRTHSHRYGGEKHSHDRSAGATYFSKRPRGQRRKWSVDLDIVDDWCYPKESR